MPVESPFSHETWAFKVPRLAGLPGGWTAEDMIRLLQMGKGPGGERPVVESDFQEGSLTRGGTL